MSGPRIDPTTLPLPQNATETAPRPAPTVAELTDALAGLAGDLVRVDQATRLARAQSQVEALLYAAQLAAMRGDQQGLRGLAAEAGRLSRDLSAAGLQSDQVAAIVAQAQRVGQICEDGVAVAAPIPSPDPTDVVT